MERINTIHTQQYNPASVLINIREPYDKNTLWIKPTKDGNFEIKVFQNGWKTISTSKDLGLSEVSSKQVNSSLQNLNLELTKQITKQQGKLNGDSVLLFDKINSLKEKVNSLESKVDKLTNKYSKLLSIINE